jgi:perosamine synthetase
MIPYGRHHIGEEDIQAVVDVLKHASLTQGPMVEAFEMEIAKYVGAKYAVAVSSCTAGLHLAALVAGVRPGRYLATSPITFVSTANAAIFAGGRPIFADIDPETINLSAGSLKELLAEYPDTAAVVPVHFAGLPCDMPAIKAAADTVGAIVIEDAAHALGAIYPDGKRVGSCPHSLMTVFSFHPVKAIATGEGGMITTNDEATYRRLMRLRSHGINKLDDSMHLSYQAETNGVMNPWYYEMQELGFHYRITDIQCALGISQLKQLNQFLSRRHELVAQYDDAFSRFSCCHPAQLSDRDNSAHHLYILRINFEESPATRAELMWSLRNKGIITQVHYIPVPAHPYYRKLGCDPKDYPNAWKYYSEALSIPLFFDLTNDQQQFVLDSLCELVG